MSVQTFDQQLFAIAVEVKCACYGEFKDHHPILQGGGPHTLYIHSWYRQRMENQGLHDLIADSRVYSPGSVDQILAEKQHSRSIRAMTLMSEALMETYIESFMFCVQDESDQDIIPDTLWNQLGEAHTTFSCQTLVSLPLFRSLKESWKTISYLK